MIQTFYADKNLRSLEVTVNKELTSVCNWLLMANKLSLNTKKSNFVIFRPYQKRMNFDVTIKLFDDKNSLILLERKDYVKYLGVLIDSTLTWKQHILFISSKISILLIGIISKLRHFVPTDTLLSIYRSLIQPYIIYGIAVS